MKNITTFETARALKEVGFPQPEPEAGQVWYDKDGERFVCLSSTGYMVAVDGGDVFQAPDMSGLIYAATATDILRELDEEYTLGYSKGFEEWWCESDTGYASRNTNSAEACAEKYFEPKRPTRA